MFNVEPQQYVPAIAVLFNRRAESTQELRWCVPRGMELRADELRRRVFLHPCPGVRKTEGCSSNLKVGKDKEYEYIEIDTVS
jgi:hypothetical protein